MSITIDTQSTVYIATDVTGGSMYVLRPKSGRCESVEHLRLDDPDPHGPAAQDQATYLLLKDHSDMEEDAFEL